ncbi:MAG: tRNA (adenosine(37)-N6)-threonylcarbamoyltransferase complex dimerization subunit type 1 TsaB [Dehalococcoidia bacterium]|nr:tRNA (adenosine(37)-N6)-threonylcarbamoyltransferase complex dimerization subunit type 1 TsaB [Dehalococcoidia bacterium]
MELALDTSTETASVALANRGNVQVEVTWHAGQNHSVELLPNLAYALKLAGVTIGEITGIAVARGPGSFNGLRVGVSTAKGLSLALGVPLVGIGTLEVEAFPHAGRDWPVCAVSDAGRGEIAAALYQTKRGCWQQLVPERITTVEELCAGIEGRTLFCGRMTEGIISQINERLGKRAIVVGGASALRRAGYLAELGWRRLQVNDVDDLASLQPIYLRRPHITEAKPLHPRP